MLKKIDEELKAREVRLVMQQRAGYPTLTAAVQAVAKQVGVVKSSVRRWVAQAEVDAGTRPGHDRGVGGAQASQGREPTAA